MKVQRWCQVGLSKNGVYIKMAPSLEKWWSTNHEILAYRNFGQTQIWKFGDRQKCFGQWFPWLDIDLVPKCSKGILKATTWEAIELGRVCAWELKIWGHGKGQCLQEGKKWHPTSIYRRVSRCLASDRCRWAFDCVPCKVLEDSQKVDSPINSSNHCLHDWHRVFSFSPWADLYHHTIWNITCNYV